MSLQTKVLSFSFTSGGGPSSQQLSVSNQGIGVISFTALPSTADGGGWHSVSPLRGAASSAVPAYLNVTVTPGSLGAGTYSGSITIASADTGESIVVPLTMSISAAQQKILLSQTGLTFIAVAKAGPPLPQIREADKRLEQRKRELAGEVIDVLPEPEVGPDGW